MAIKLCKRCGKEFQAKAGAHNAKYCWNPCLPANSAYATKYSDARRLAYSRTGNFLCSHGRPCEVCGTFDKVEAHHDDYAKPLDVRWLCKRHHRLHHVQHGPGKNAFRATEECAQ